MPESPAADQGPAVDSRGRHETEAERLDRQFDDLLQELRVSQAGVQILFAFLLTIAFSTGFKTITDFERDIYIVTLVTTAAATACFIGPVSYARIVFRQGQRRAVVDAGSRMAITGLALLLVAISCSVLLVTHVALGNSWSAVLAAAVAALLATVWYVIPLLHRYRGLRSSNRSSPQGS